MQTDISDPSETGGEKNQRLEKIISELEILDYQGIKDNAFDYSSDEGVGEFIPQIKELSKEIPGEIRTALIIGGGPIWNIPKTLDNIDLIISLDINKEQLERNKLRKQEILSAEYTQDLFPKPNQNIDNKDIVSLAQERMRLKAPHIEIDSYGDYHYLYSEETLKRTKNFLKTAKIAYVCGDISDKDFTTQFGNILHKNGVTIVFADFSNVGEWVCGSHPNMLKRDTLISSLNLIPIDSKCPILHSESIGRVGRSPIYSRLSIGVKQYGESIMSKLIRY